MPNVVKNNILQTKFFLKKKTNFGEKFDEKVFWRQKKFGEKTIWRKTICLQIFVFQRQIWKMLPKFHS